MSETALQQTIPTEPVVHPATILRRASQHAEKGRGHGLSFIFWLLEQSRWVLLAIPTLFATVVTLIVRGDWMVFAASWVAVPVFFVLLPLFYLVYRSYQDDTEGGPWEEFVTWKNPKDAEKWMGKKIPMEVLYEAYMAEKLD